MSLREILHWPDPRLAEICDAVPEIGAHIAALVADMFETMYDANGRGLAAPQVGELVRVFVMDAGWKEGTKTPIAMINPQILTSSDDSVEIEEGCLSIPDFPLTVRRPARVKMLWQDLQGAPHQAWLDGAEARIAQHEHAHLLGRVIFDEFAPEEAGRLQARYLERRT
ncbi:Peptide deformylase [Candidatus Rhodobacter oscarellae]|uniref:Peptide deformylase n=1 Tax=Candidatus Rhodobacter oscarellae TaxID=1675527 RepID=A0A0J9E8Z5_9RHOB|nr:peptide deformylase [Candidatus Rhodobacter lobularis]KMW59265.1 Peptide deformylase [Candidatus Rhodobacter lobularis]